MTRDELLGSLRAVELRLSTSEVTSFFRDQNPAVRNDFVDLSLQVSIEVSRLTNAELSDIAGRLEALSPDLKAGIADLQRMIVRLENAVGIVNTLGTVLGLVARVLAL